MTAFFLFYFIERVLYILLSVRVFYTQWWEGGQNGKEVRKHLQRSIVLTCSDSYRDFVSFSSKEKEDTGKIL